LFKVINTVHEEDVEGPYGWKEKRYTKTTEIHCGSMMRSIQVELKGGMITLKPTSGGWERSISPGVYGFEFVFAMLLAEDRPDDLDEFVTGDAWMMHIHNMLEDIPDEDNGP
jgi:hypothetical protein